MRTLLAIMVLVSLAACGGGSDDGGAGSGASSGGAATSGNGGGAGGNGGGAANSGGGANGGNGGSGGDDTCTPGGTTLRRLWRLTPVQYDNTIRDLFGLTGSWGATFPSDTVIAGFANNGEALTVSPLLADKLRDAAEDIAARVELGSLAPCAASQTDAACMNEIIATTGARAFRRPLAQADVDRYAALAATEPTFEAGARLVVTALLQSPHFLYRRELGTPDPADTSRYLLDDYEVASELSYLLWQTTPDDALLQAAQAGELHTAEQIEAAAMRMLSDDKVRPTVRAFVLEWLGLDTIATVPKDPGTFPELTAEMRASLRGEVERFIDHVMFEGDGSLQALLTSPDTFLNTQLAELYGVTMGGSADADGFALTQIADQERMGILTLGGTMMRHGRSNDSSPVHRGKLVRERILCQVPPPPPPGIVVQPPAADPTKTARERYAAHSQLQPCQGCHVLMDPIGFSFERFDGIGRYRTEDNGQAIDVSGEIIETDNTNGTFAGTEELAGVLAASPDVAACMTRQWLRFAYGLRETTAVRCMTQPLIDALSSEGVTLERLVRASATAEQLRVRISANDAPAPEPDAGMTGGDGDGDGDGDQPEPDAGVEPSGDVTFVLDVHDDFTSGYCDTYVVTNVSAAPVTWSKTIDLGGSLTQHWESLVDGASGVQGVTGTVTFTGVMNNATLQPDGVTRFGFCVMR